MRGEVEIWEGDKLLHREPNMLVDGAGELLADIMTVSPSLSGIADHATSSILDTSNYTIQAISFGKDASAYTLNAHALNKYRNLYGNSTFSSLDDPGMTGGLGTVSSTPEVQNPPGFEDTPSSVAHVVAYIDNTSTSNKSISYSFNVNDANFPDLTLSAGQDQWFCRSTYVKLGVPDYPVYRPAHQYNYHRIHYKMQVEGEGNVFTSHALGSGLGRARSSTDPNFGDENISFSSVVIGFTGDNRLNDTTLSGGYSVANWDSNGGIIPVGNNWYRVWTSLLAPVSGVSAITCTTYPLSHDGAEPIGETSGGIYAFGEQFEIGRWPTELQFRTDGVAANNWDFSGSVLNSDHNPGATTDKGTVRVIPPYGTSSYVPTNYISSPPNPNSTRVEDGDTDLFGSSSVTSGFSMGQNLNVIPYRAQYNQEPNKTFYAEENNVDYGSEMKALFDAGGGAPSGTFSIGPQAYYLGCFPEGSSTGGSNFALVSSLDNSAAYPINYAASSDPNFVSGIYNSILNEASSMDVSGFVGKVYDPQNTVAPVANPNLLAYTDDPGSSPGVTFPNDLDGTYWGADQTKVASYSSVEFTNPFGGPSSMLCSGLSSWPDDGDGLSSASGYGLCIATTNTSRIPLFPAASSTTYIASIFVKRPTDGYETSSCMLNLKDNTDPVEAYIAVWEFDGAVPSLKNGDTGITTHQEDYGNGWWRLQVRLKGSDVTKDTVAGDRMNLYFYGGDNTNLGGGNYTPSSNWTGKTMYAYAPQMEVYPDAYDISATPYQAVAGVSPLVSENQGQGGLHVSGGIDATNAGTVEYSITVCSGDVGYSNLYGGIYNMGLWTIDMDKTLKAGNTPPYSFGPLNNPRKYKLFSTKHLTQNLGYIVDNGTAAGAMNYSDLTIKWRIHFL